MGPLAIERRRFARLRAAWDRHGGLALVTTALIVAIAGITVATLLYR